jgi:hypothetical protein
MESIWQQHERFKLTNFSEMELFRPKFYQDLTSNRLHITIKYSMCYESNCGGMLEMSRAGGSIASPVDG